MEVVEAALLWRVQAILETLQLDKLDAWFRQVDLTGGIEELKSEIERMQTVIMGVKGRAVMNKPLARSLDRVMELMLHADDMVDELDYYRLEHQIKEAALAPAIEPEGMVGDHGDLNGADQINALSNTGILNYNVRKNRSKEWDNFRIIKSIDGEPMKAQCIDCGALVRWGHGTSVLRKHRKSYRCKSNRAAIEQTPNVSSASDIVQNDATILTNNPEGRKRKGIEDIGTTTHSLNSTGFLKRIHDIAIELRRTRGNVIEYLRDSAASFDQYQSNTYAQVRTSSSLPGKVYGRDVEKGHIIEVIKAAKSDSITVLPIVGIIGVGKTALAKLVYNDPIVETQFERIWVWVSNVFDEVRVTREILDIVTLDTHEGCPRNKESYDGVRNYAKLQEVLKKYMSSRPKRFLLVLDDVSDSMDNTRWEDLLGTLGASRAQGNVIIVTARNLSVAQRLGTVEPVKLGALKDDDFWLLFKACACGDNNCEEYLEIGRQIAAKLKGNPLAAQNAAEMLREQPTIDHWKGILKSGVWESLQLRGGIVTALKSSYYQLPYHLQQCFLFCSIFPINYQFHIDSLVNAWTSLGFVKSIGIEHDFLSILVNSGFFEQVPCNEKCFAMCDIMYEFARVVSWTEFATIDGLDCKEVPPTVRHLSILTDSVYHKNDSEIILRYLKFEEKMRNIVSSVRRLRTLILIGHDSLLLQSFNTFVLHNSTHLRYLKLENQGSIEALPISMNKFYHLEVLDAGHPTIIHGISDLVSMRHVILTKEDARLASPAWFSTSVTCLQTIHLEDCKRLETLPSLDRIPFLRKLKLIKLLNVMTVVIPSLEELVLINMEKLERCSSNSVWGLNSSLRVLEIKRCCVLKAFPLFESSEKLEQKSWLPHVRELTIHDCPLVMVSHPLPPSRNFCKLSISRLHNFPTMEGSSNGELKIGLCGPGLEEMLTILDSKILSFHNLMALTSLRISWCKNLTYVSLKGFRQLVSLRMLEIHHCTKFVSSNVLPEQTHQRLSIVAKSIYALPSLKCLRIVDCGITGESLSVMLQNVLALEELHLEDCEQISGLLIEGKENSLSNPDDVLAMSCPDKSLRVPSRLIFSLRRMAIYSCRDLTFHGNTKGLSEFMSLKDLGIFYCPKLIASLVDKNKINDLASGRWLLPRSLGVLGVKGGSLETLQPFFPGHLAHLTELEVLEISGLKSLQLNSCTALEKLTIKDCKSLEALEDIQSLRCLRYLKLSRCPGLPRRLEILSTQVYELYPQLEMLWIDNYTFLTMSFCKHLTSLKILEVKYGDYLSEDIYVEGLTDTQETALHLLKSLQMLRLTKCYQLPVGLHSLPSLKRLQIFDCRSISRLPERGLPPSLYELEVCGCSEELTMQCRMLATRKLTVKIDGKYVG